MDLIRNCNSFSGIISLSKCFRMCHSLYSRGWNFQCVLEHTDYQSMSSVSTTHSSKYSWCSSSEIYTQLAALWIPNCQPLMRRHSRLEDCYREKLTADGHAEKSRLLLHDVVLINIFIYMYSYKCLWCQNKTYNSTLVTCLYFSRGQCEYNTCRNILKRIIYQHVYI